jgi:hypothetical protein
MIFLPSAGPQLLPHSGSSYRRLLAFPRSYRRPLRHADEFFYWMQLLGAAGAIVLLVVSVVLHRAAVGIQTLDRFDEAWERLHRSRQALVFALLFALLAVAAVHDGAYGW